MLKLEIVELELVRVVFKFDGGEPKSDLFLGGGDTEAGGGRGADLAACQEEGEDNEEFEDDKVDDVTVDIGVEVTFEWSKSWKLAPGGKEGSTLGGRRSKGGPSV